MSGKAAGEGEQSCRPEEEFDTKETEESREAQESERSGGCGSSRIEVDKTELGRSAGEIRIGVGGVSVVVGTRTGEVSTTEGDGLGRDSAIFSTTSDSHTSFEAFLALLRGLLALRV